MTGTALTGSGAIPLFVVVDLFLLCESSPCWSALASSSPLKFPPTQVSSLLISLLSLSFPPLNSGCSPVFSHPPPILISASAVDHFFSLLPPSQPSQCVRSYVDTPTLTRLEGSLSR